MIRKYPASQGALRQANQDGKTGGGSGSPDDGGSGDSDSAGDNNKAQEKSKQDDVSEKSPSPDSSLK